MFIVTQTPRIAIREFFPEELETYLAHFTDEKVALYIPKRSRDERITIFNNALNQYTTTKLFGTWGMFNRVNGEFIGSCLLRPFNNDTDILELGYSIEQKYWGLGMATEMVQAMLAYGFNNTSITEIVALTTMANMASQRVLEKTGFKRVDNLVRNDEELACFKLLR